ncbi:hypothetical protein RMCBS344292_12951 [Rhizopus microsporus]|nr:hypothetical protein RMCBS344292_12951 [Rhizopus microsporus]
MVKDNSSNHSFLHSFTRKKENMSIETLINDTSHKKSSLDIQRSITEEDTPEHSENRPRKLSRSSSLTSLDKLKREVSQEPVNRKSTDSGRHTISSLIKKRKESRASKISFESNRSLSTNSSSGHGSDNYIQQQQSSIMISESDLLSERPGSFAAVCEFQLATEKKNEAFHALFKSVPQTDKLIEVYKCALQKEILLQGHMYVSEHHVCFKSNIFGFVTNLIINFHEITDVQKKMTAKIIPNGILIKTNTIRHTFASFISRDQAYDQIVKIWKLHKRITPTSSSIPGTYARSLEDDKQYFNSSASFSSGHSNDSAIMTNSPPVLLTDEPVSKETVISRPVLVAHENKPAAATLLTVENTPVISSNRPRSISDSYKDKVIPSPIIVPSRPNHNSPEKNSAKTEPVEYTANKTVICPCMKSNKQYTHVALDRTYHGTVEAMDKLLFETDFIKSFLERCENFGDVELGVWQNNSRSIKGKRRIKTSAMSTRVINILFQEKRAHHKLPYYSCVIAKKYMPDMPMGNVYYIQSRTCITRMNKSKVRVLITFEVSFKKSGLVSSIIENNAADDQFRQYNHLNEVLSNSDLAKELIRDHELLMILKLAPRDKFKNPIKWLDHTVYPTSQSLIFLAFCLVFLSHIILSARVMRVTNRIQELRACIANEVNYLDDTSIHFAIEEEGVQSVLRLYSRLEEIKNQIKQYDERIIDLKDNMK